MILKEYKRSILIGLSLSTQSVDDITDLRLFYELHLIDILEDTEKVCHKQSLKTLPSNPCTAT